MGRINWKDAGRRIVEEGTYKTRVVNWKKHVAATGNPVVIIEHEIIGPEELGAKISDFLTLVDNCSWRVAQFVEGCGINIANLPEMEMSTGDIEFCQVLDKCKDRTLWVRVVKEKRNGEERNKIIGYTIDNEQDVIDDVVDIPEFLKDKVKGMGMKGGKK